jgi:hypothetical protein
MRGQARRAFGWGAWLVFASVIVQVTLAGLGVFANSGFFFWHSNINGAVVFFLPLLLILVGWLGRVPIRLRWLTAAVPALVVLQSLLLIPYHMNAHGVLRAISALHVVNAFFIFWVAFELVDRTRLYMATTDVPAKI